jgi:hypothetical protein
MVILFREDRVRVSTSKESSYQQHYQAGTPLCINSILDMHMYIMSLCIAYSMVSKHQLVTLWLA